ncbi:hypothetical protein VPH35_034593 [Triticum aestivum]|uniref:uncharacterized protein isoform X1 n=2 Tax=Triticum aestivum TaxID=4565 RepID=UPI001D007D5F|nr:uncharacterized protein LOC123051378 isoform X1 [Triticum aestivum]
MTSGGRKREEIGEGGSAADGTGSPAGVGLRRRVRSPSCQIGKGDGTGIRGGGGGGTAGTGRGDPRQTSGRQQGAPHGEERTRSTPSFPTRYEKEEIGPRKLVAHIFMCRAEKKPNGELGMPSNVQVAFVLSSTVWSLSIALLARHHLGWRLFLVLPFVLVRAN